MQRKPRLWRQLMASLAIGGAGAIALGSGASANSGFWLTGYYPGGGAQKECAWVNNGVYGTVWYTQNIAYVDYGGDCNAQHNRDAYWLLAQSTSANGNTITGTSAREHNAANSYIVQANVSFHVNDDRVYSGMWYWEAAIGAYAYASVGGP